MKKFMLLLTLVCLTFLAVGVKADIAVPDFDPQGGSIATPGNTKISMEYEKVIITYDKPGKEEMSGHVSAVFKLKNNDSTSVTIPIVFPAQDNEFIGGLNGQKPITNFYVNKKTINQIDSATVTINGNQKEISTYNWQETFLPSEEKEITLTYDVVSGKFYNTYFVSYILATGSTWYGPIKAGEISIIFPSDLTDYSVSDALVNSKMFSLPKDGVLAMQTPIKYKINGNTINYSFSNYEPMNDVIALGVADFDLVNNVETQKNSGQDAASLLKLAKLYQELSVGAHCFWCVGKAGELAKTTYFQALEKAQTKEQLDEVILNFTTASGEVGTMGSGLEDKFITNSVPNIEYIKYLMSSESCSLKDAACISNSYGYRDTFGNSPISLNMNSREVNNLDFLQKASAKAKSLSHPTLAKAIDTYIKNAPIAFKYLKQKEVEVQQVNDEIQANVSASPAAADSYTSTTTSTSNQKNAGSSQANTNYHNFLQVIIIIIVVVAAGLLGFLFYKKSVRPTNHTTNGIDNSRSTQLKLKEADGSAEKTIN